MSELLLQLDAISLSPTFNGAGVALEPSPDVLQAAQQVLLDAGMPEADVQAMPWPELSAASFAAVLVNVGAQSKSDETSPLQQTAAVGLHSKPSSLDVLVSSRFALPTEVLPAPESSLIRLGQTSVLESSLDAATPIESTSIVDLTLPLRVPEPHSTESAQALGKQINVDFGGLKTPQMDVATPLQAVPQDLEKPSLAAVDPAPAPQLIATARLLPVDDPQTLGVIQINPVAPAAERPMPVQQKVPALEQINSTPNKAPVVLPANTTAPAKPTALPTALPTKLPSDLRTEQPKVVAKVVPAEVVAKIADAVVKAAPTVLGDLLPKAVQALERPSSKPASAPVSNMLLASDFEQLEFENTPTARLTFAPQSALLGTKVPLNVSPGQEAIDWLQDSQFFSDRMRTGNSAVTLNLQTQAVSAEQSLPTIAPQAQLAVPIVNPPVATPVEMSQPLLISARAEGLQAVVNEALKTIEMRLPGRVELSMLLRDGQKLELVVHAQQQKMDIEISGIAAQMMSEAWSDGSDTLIKTLDTLGYQLQSLRVNGETVQAASAQVGAGLDMAQQQRGGGREQDSMQFSPREGEREENASSPNMLEAEAVQTAPLTSKGAVSLYA